MFDANSKKKPAHRGSPQRAERFVLERGGRERHQRAVGNHCEKAQGVQYFVPDKDIVYPLSERSLVPVQEL